MKVYTAAIEALYLTLVEVEADISAGLPSFTIVGLGDTSVHEARERIRSALKNSSFNFPIQKKIINLSPANVKKQGSHYDLPIALSMLLASGQIRSLDRPLFCVGELMLSGRIRKVPGIVPIVKFAKEKGFSRIFIPYPNRKEAALIKGIDIYPVKHLKELIFHLEGKNVIQIFQEDVTSSKVKAKYDVDFSEIQGQEIPKRVLEIAASGGHHVLFYGPPGTGKTLLSKAYPGILQDINDEEKMDINMIYSVADDKSSLPIMTRPFRHLHHSTTNVTLLGGGNPIKIGEVTLAHKGVLFLDEFAEFSKTTINNLRGPLQEGVIRLGRYGKMFKLPAHFQLIAAMNPCSCGFMGDDHKNCQCTPFQIKQYYKRISGPILDRIDLISEVPRLPSKKILSNRKIESSNEIKKRVIKAREIQLERGMLNSQITMKKIKKICQLNIRAENFMKEILERKKISPRSYLSILKVSRTIADMEKSNRVKKEHIAEAVQYRSDFVY